MSWPVWLFPHNGHISYCHYKGWNDLVGPLSFNFADISMLKGRGCGSVVLLDSNNTIKLTSPLSLFMLCMFCCFAPKWTWDGFSQPLCCSFTVVYTKFHGSFSNPSLCLILTRKALFLFWGPLNSRGGGTLTWTVSEFPPISRGSFSKHSTWKADFILSRRKPYLEPRNERNGWNGNATWYD